MSGIRTLTGTSRALAVSAIVILVIAAVVLAVAVKRGAFADRIDSVAVLPFANLSGNPGSEYLSDGISESVMDSLSQLPQLQVIARSTVFRYKGRNVDPLNVGRELKVRGVVTGQLVQRGDTLVVRASLTDVKRGTQVWGQEYDRSLSDVLSLQHDLSEEISKQLRFHLSGDEKKMLARGRSDDSEAFQLYLKGRYFVGKFNDEESIRRGIDFFNQAIERDPTYALAYAGLADAYYNLSNLHMAPREAMPRAREAAQHALALDDSLSLAHTCLALVKVWYDWDFVRGEQEFRRAIALNPNDADARRRYGDYLAATGKFERAIAEKRRAEQLDPLSINASWEVGRALYYAGRYDEARAQAEKALELDRNFPYAYYLLAQIAFRRGEGDVPRALALLDEAMKRGGRTPLLVATWGYMNARAGNRAEAMKAISELRTRPGKYTLPLFLARIHAALGENDEAMKNLEHVYADRSESVVWLGVDPSFDPLRNDPRFIALLKRIRLV